MTFQICKEADGFRVLTINLDDQVKQLSAMVRQYETALNYGGFAIYPPLYGD